MHTLTLGDVSISRIVEIGRSSFPTAQMLPESDAGKIASHHRWIKPHFFDDVTGDLGSRIQTWIVRTPRQTVLVSSTHQIDPWLAYEPWVGHTPGHAAVRAHTRAGDAVFSGDLMHRVVQVAEPQWSSIFCYDGRQAAVTRKAFVERHGASGDLVLPAHFPHPGR